jgi:predicted nuclease of predicted toxin-antitoxin system
VIFVVDQQLPHALCKWLTDRGHEAEHVRNIGLRDARDSVIWRHAVDVGAIVTTKDEDLPPVVRVWRLALKFSGFGLGT